MCLQPVPRSITAQLAFALHALWRNKPSPVTSEGEMQMPFVQTASANQLTFITAAFGVHNLHAAIVA